jgi:hypothetical protein
MDTHTSHKVEQTSVGILERNTNIHPFVSAAKGVKNWGSTREERHLPVAVLMLFFTEIFRLLVEQTNLYYHQHIGRQARPSRQLPDSTFSDMVTLIALALQMGHKLNGTLHDCWSRLRLSYTLHFTARSWDRFLHILRFLHSAQGPDQGKVYDRLWNYLWHTEPAFDKFYNSSEHLAVDELIVKFKGRVKFRQ